MNYYLNPVDSDVNDQLVLVITLEFYIPLFTVNEDLKEKK